MNEVEYQRMRACEDRHWWYTTLHALMLRQVAAEARMRGPLTIFDAGCGTGGLLAKLNKLGNVSGCDFSPHAVAACHARGLSNVTQRDLNDPALPDENFDVITCVDVIEHDWIRSDADLLSRLYAALKPGGLLLLNCTALEWLRSTHDTAVFSTRRYSRPQIHALATRTGFQIERLTYRMFLLLPLIAAYRIAARLRSRSRNDTPASDVWLPPTFVNVPLKITGMVENMLLRFISLPAGSSLFLVARKPMK